MCDFCWSRHVRTRVRCHIRLQQRKMSSRIKVCQISACLTDFSCKSCVNIRRTTGSCSPVYSSVLQCTPALVTAHVLTSWRSVDARSSPCWVACCGLENWKFSRRKKKYITKVAEGRINRSGTGAEGVNKHNSITNSWPFPSLVSFVERFHVLRPRGCHLQRLSWGHFSEEMRKSVVTCSSETYPISQGDSDYNDQNE